MIGISDKEIAPFASMFDTLACSGSSPPMAPLTAHPELSTLLQRMFNSPQTVDDYVQARMDFERGAAGGGEASAVRAGRGVGASNHSGGFVPWNVDRPFRAVLKADCAMLARFLESLSTSLPIRLRLLLITREPPSVLYTGTRSEMAQLPSGMNSEWRFFFVARVLHDHLSALVAEVKAIHPSVYHVVNVDDAILRTAHHAQQLAAFIDRSACARDIFRHLRRTPSPLLDVMDPMMEDFTVNEAAGGFDILTPLKYHGLFERAPSYSWLMEALTNHSAVAALAATKQAPDVLARDELPLDSHEEATRPAERELRLHVQGLQLMPEGEDAAVGEAVTTDGDAIISALDSLHPQSSSSCSGRRFLVFDLFLRALPCSCSNTPLPPSNPVARRAAYRRYHPRAGSHSLSGVDHRKDRRPPSVSLTSGLRRLRQVQSGCVPRIPLHCLSAAVQVRPRRCRAEAGLPLRLLLMAAFAPQRWRSTAAFPSRWPLLRVRCGEGGGGSRAGLPLRVAAPSQRPSCRAAAAVLRALRQRPALLPLHLPQPQ